MIPSEREAVISQLVQQNGVITVSEICTYCNCSPETARRDLRRLEEGGELIRTHGGAKAALSPSHTEAHPHQNRVLEARIALTDRVDALIVTPSDAKTTHLLMDRCQRADVPVIAESTRVVGAKTTVAVDNYQAGLEIGQWVAHYASRHIKDKTMVLDVSASHSNTKARSRGFADGLRELSFDQLILLRVNGQDLRESARQITADTLAIRPNINVIFGINDDSALGALDAFRAARLDESQLLLVPFGLEGQATKVLFEQNKPMMVSVAMFPELVGRACVDAAICAFNDVPLPKRIITPFAIVTRDNLFDYYQQDNQSEHWSINWTRAEQLPNVNTGFAMLREYRHRRLPKRIGYVEIFSSHEWYQNIRRTMQEYCQSRGITLEVVDASQDMALEIDTLKRKIGFAAAHHVHDGDTIILDSGYTTAYLAQALKGRQNITVITNSLRVLQELADEPGLTLVSSGGVMRSDSQALIGAGAETTFQDLRADKAFISAAGLNLDFGLSNTNIAEATAKQAIIAAARDVFLLLDSTKIGVESLIKIAPVNQIDHLITDSGISSQDWQALTQTGIEVIIAEEPANQFGRERRFYDK